MLASTQMINEVCVFFDRYLFRGNRCDKVRHNYNAFDSPNYPPLGEMRGLRFVIHERYLLPQPTGPFAVKSTMSGKVMVFAMHPGADVESIIRLLNSLTYSRSAQSITDADDKNHNNCKGNNNKQICNENISTNSSKSITATDNKTATTASTATNTSSSSSSSS